MEEDITEEQIKLMVPEMHLTGECPLNIEEVKKLWDEKFFVSQWNDTFRLGSYNGFRVTISQQQAYQLVFELGLICEQSEIFRSGKSWVSKK